MRFDIHRAGDVSVDHGDDEEREESADDEAADDDPADILAALRTGADSHRQRQRAEQSLQDRPDYGRSDIDWSD